MTNAAPRHIVVVDADSLMRDLLHELLTDEGYQVTCLPDARAAHAPLQALRPDLAILDIRYRTDPAGLALLERLRSEPTTQAIPLVVCSPDGRGLRARAPGVQQRQIALIDEPFDVDELLAVIEQCWRSAE